MTLVLVSLYKMEIFVRDAERKGKGCRVIVDVKGRLEKDAKFLLISAFVY